MRSPLLGLYIWLQTASASPGGYNANVSRHQFEPASPSTGKSLKQRLLRKAAQDVLVERVDGITALNLADLPLAHQSKTPVAHLVQDPLYQKKGYINLCIVLAALIFLGVPLRMHVAQGKRSAAHTLASSHRSLEEQERIAKYEDLRRSVHTLSAEEIEAYTGSCLARANLVLADGARLGLDESVIPQLSNTFGKNRLTAPETENVLVALCRQVFSGLFNVLLWLCVFAQAALAGIAGDELVTPIVLALVIVASGFMQWYTELQAQMVIDSLLNMQSSGDVLAWRRNPAADPKVPQMPMPISPDHLLPGDVITLEAGQQVPADCRVLDCTDGALVENSALTGESIAEPRLSTVAPEDQPIIEAKNVLFSGTAIVNGRLVCVVYAIGDQTMLGEIASKIKGARTKSSLEHQIEHFVHIIAFVAVLVGLLTLASNYMAKRKKSTLAIFRTTATAVFCQVPEGLLPTVTAVLLISARQMADEHVVVRRMDAVESLGCVSVLCSDKTGTLTSGCMTATDFVLPARAKALEGKVAPASSAEGGFGASKLALAEPVDAKTDSEPIDPPPENKRTDAEAEPVDAKPDEDPLDAKPPNTNPVDAKPNANPADSKPDAESADAKPDAEPADAKTDAEPADAKTDAEPADVNQATARENEEAPASSSASGSGTSKLADVGPVDTKTDAEPSDPKPEGESADVEPDANPVDAEQGPATPDEKPVDAKSDAKPPDVTQATARENEEAPVSSSASGSGTSKADAMPVDTKPGAEPSDPKPGEKSAYVEPDANPVDAESEHATPDAKPGDAKSDAKPPDVAQVASDRNIADSDFSMQRIIVKQLPIEPDESLKALALCGVLNSTAKLGSTADKNLVGSPTEVAITAACIKALGMTIEHVRATYPQVFEIPFSSTTKWMLTIHSDKNCFRLIVKGAPERVMNMCHLTPESSVAITKELQDLMCSGKRVLCLADLELRGLAQNFEFKGSNADDANFPCKDLVFRGLVGIEDPPRAGVQEAISRLTLAGIRTVMVTGDHADTAAAIAERLGILDGINKDNPFAIIPGDRLEKFDLLEGETFASISAGLACRNAHGVGVGDRGSHYSHAVGPYERLEFWKECVETTRVFARVSPIHKQSIIRAFQQLGGHIVGMTGDGVNDAPALKAAEVGIAMGIRGTEVAKEAADLLLLDDDFTSVVAGVEQGRLCADNLRKSIKYTLCSKVPQLLPGFAEALGWPLALTALQVLLIDIGTDIWTAIAYAWQPAEDSLMKSLPRHPLKDRMVNKELLAYSYGYMGSLQGCFCWLCWFSMPLMLHMVYNVTDVADYTDVEVESVTRASTMYYWILVCGQVAAGLATTTTRQSLLQYGLPNSKLTFLIVMEVAFSYMVIYHPKVRQTFSCLPLTTSQFLCGFIAIVLIVAIEEVRKQIARASEASHES